MVIPDYLNEREDPNRARSGLGMRLRTAGHSGTAIYEIGNASGDTASTGAGEILSQQAESLNEESPTSA